MFVIVIFLLSQKWPHTHQYNTIQYNTIQSKSHGVYILKQYSCDTPFTHTHTHSHTTKQTNKQTTTKILQVIEINESKYVNVDTTTVQGIQRAVDLGLATSSYADLVVSSYLHQSASLFDLHHQARAFLLLRNPIERATSMYYHRVHELGDLDPEISIEDFAQGNGIENNWMTRFLTDRMEGELTKADLEQAKDILKQKFMVGFIDDIEESIYRFMKYNRWKYAEDENQKMKEEDCVRDLAMVGSNINPNEYELPKRGTQAYALITWQTQFDTKLYEYGKELFDLQTKTYGSKERKKILKKQKKKGGKL
mmetsp:Transcript_29325/g.56105  ORF Transcript_29325/g.56105 Transcript_29325/m.56105 type:complete len:309 (-) Transcript_29325:374-1300(-)